MTTQTSKPEFLTRREFAELARVDERTLRRWHKAGYGPKGNLIGAQYRYNTAECWAFLTGKTS